jgi:hypothetical protein
MGGAVLGESASFDVLDAPCEDHVPAGFQRRLADVELVADLFRGGRASHMYRVREGSKS